MTPTPNDRCPYGWRQSKDEVDCSHAAASQGMPIATSDHREDSPPSPQKEHSLANILILDFFDVWNCKTIFLVANFVAVCCRSLRTNTIPNSYFDRPKFIGHIFVEEKTFGG